MTTLEFQNAKNLFTSSQGTWTDVQSICIGTQNHQSLSQALRLTSLPSQLRALSPSLKIYVYPRGMNSVVFKGNPHVHGVRRLPREILGEGQLKSHPEQGLSKPEIYLSPSESFKIRKFLKEKTLPANTGKPLCILHAWKPHTPNVRDVDYWDSVVSRWSHRFRFWQVGLKNDSAIQGCEYYFLPRRSSSNARSLFALMGEAQAFVGIDASPFLVSRAFEIPSLTVPAPGVLIDSGLKRMDEFFESILKLKSKI